MCTIVVGAVVMVAEVSVHPRAFGRDVGSYTLVLLLTVGTAAVGSVNIYTALLFIVLYLVYVGAVMIFDNLAREKKKRILSCPCPALRHSESQKCLDYTRRPRKGYI